MLQQEQVGRADAEHHDGMAIDAIAQTTARRARAIFRYRQRVDVADAAAGKIPRGGVMQRMLGRTFVENLDCATVGFEHIGHLSRQPLPGIRWQVDHA